MKENRRRVSGTEQRAKQKGFSNNTENALFYHSCGHIFFRNCKSFLSVSTFIFMNFMTYCTNSKSGRPSAAWLRITKPFTSGKVISLVGSRSNNTVSKMAGRVSSLLEQPRNPSRPISMRFPAMVRAELYRNGTFYFMAFRFSPVPIIHCGHDFLYQAFNRKRLYEQSVYLNFKTLTICYAHFLG